MTDPEQNLLVCSDCGKEVRLFMEGSGSLIASCGCEWARPSDIPQMEDHVWWPAGFETSQFGRAHKP